MSAMGTRCDDEGLGGLQRPPLVRAKMGAGQNLGGNRPRRERHRHMQPLAVFGAFDRQHRLGGDQAPAAGEGVLVGAGVWRGAHFTAGGVDEAALVLVAARPRLRAVRWPLNGLSGPLGIFELRAR